MIKFEYDTKPFYTEYGLNEPCTKKLSVEFDDEATATEIIAELIKLLLFSGYSFVNDKAYLIRVVEELEGEDIIKDYRKENDNDNT